MVFDEGKAKRRGLHDRIPGKVTGPNDPQLQGQNAMAGGCIITSNGVRGGSEKRHLGAVANDLIIARSEGAAHRNVGPVQNAGNFRM